MKKQRVAYYCPEKLKSREDVASIVGKVISVGDTCYPETDPRFASGPCGAKKETVMVSKYAGHRFEYDGVEMRVMNDDSILAVVDDPTKVSRATA